VKQKDLQSSLKGGSTLTVRIRQLVHNLPRDNQKGFTLIEMLVVISILGILAAVVTMSMIGVTSLAQSNANKAELKEVQVAMDTMASQQQVASNSVCLGAAATSVGSATNDMTSFPFPATSPAASTGPVPLYPTYIRAKTTNQAKYWCDTDGTVHSTAVSGS
jgi:type IV pilus assembly protein PilA